MTLSEFKKRASDNSKFLDPDAIGKVMGMLLDMPLEQMYSPEMNRIPETGERDPFIYIAAEPTPLNGNKSIPSLTLKDFIGAVCEMSQSSVTNHPYHAVMKSLSLWHKYMVPATYQPKGEFI